MDGLVSIVTPCYNSERFIARLIESILNQTYTNIEFILINDGSTDGTDEIIARYEKRLRDKCKRFIYVHQENEGRVDAIKSGLALVRGEYLVWADSDDFFMERSIEKRVDFLVQHKDYGLVCCRGRIVEEYDLNKVTRFINQMRSENGDMSQIIRKGIFPAAGFYFIRTKIFFEYYKNKEVISSQAAQNWQLVLPFLIYYKCGYLQEELYTVVRTNNSVSRKERSREEVKQRYQGIEDLLVEIIKQMQDQNEEKYIKIVRDHYRMVKMKFRK